MTIQVPAQSDMQHVVITFFEPRYKKTCIRGTTQPQKIARGMFRIKEVEGLYCLCSENKGADQLCNYCAAGLQFVFVYVKSRFSHDAAHL